MTNSRKPSSILIKYSTAGNATSEELIYRLGHSEMATIQVALERMGKNAEAEDLLLLIARADASMNVSITFFH